MITALILAAGESKRFGEPKQLARIAGKALLQHAIDCVNASRADEVLLVLGAHADEIREQIDPGRARVAVNANYAGGMSTSIIAGVKAASEETSAVMIVLADQPFVLPQTLDHLIDQYEEKHPSAVIPTHNGSRGNPVIVGRALFGEMLELTGDTGCRAILRDHAESVVMLAVDDPGVVMDVDTVEDLSRGAQSASS